MNFTVQLTGKIIKIKMGLLMYFGNNKTERDHCLMALIVLASCLKFGVDEEWV
jgi:hypothetical protein